MQISAENLQKIAQEYLFEGDRNAVSAADALSKEYAGMPIFRPPVLVGISSACDPLYLRLKDKSVIGGLYRHPAEWVGNAESVISVFLPFSKEVCGDNSADNKTFSYGWMHARNEGQALLNAVGIRLKDTIEENGGVAVIPSLDSRFRYIMPDKSRGETHANSVWSERHVAYISGLGTFGLSTCLITKEGTAGRFISIVTDMKLEPTPRDYTDIHEYCIKCGRCLKNCPVDAIYKTAFSKDGGNIDDELKSLSLKDIQKCSDYVDLSEKMYYPRYGCGKCQVNVPCMDKRPKRGL